MVIEAENGEQEQGAGEENAEMDSEDEIPSKKDRSIQHQLDNVLDRDTEHETGSEFVIDTDTEVEAPEKFDEEEWARFKEM